MYDVGEDILHKGGLVDGQFEIETTKSTPWIPNSQNQPKPKPLKNAGKGETIRASL